MKNQRRRVKIEMDLLPTKTKIEVVECYMCRGDGYYVDDENRADTEYTSNSCNFINGCSTCGGSGHRAYSGWCTQEEQIDTLVKGSGLVEQHFTWDYASKSWQSTRWSRDLPYPKPFKKKSESFLEEYGAENLIVSLIALLGGFFIIFKLVKL